MEMSPIPISKLKGSLSHATKVSSAGDLILGIHVKKLTIVLSVVSICSSIATVASIFASIYIEEAMVSLRQPYMNISNFLKKANEIEGERLGINIYRHNKNTSDVYGVITATKPNLYQTIIDTGDCTAPLFLFVALAFSLVSFVIPLSVVNRPLLINRFCIFLSSLRMIANIVCQAEATDISKPVENDVKLNAVKKFATYTDQDMVNAKKLASFCSNICAITLSFASFFYLIDTYKIPNIRGISILIACANLCFMLHGYVGDYYNMSVCLANEYKTRLITLGVQISGTVYTDDKKHERKKGLMQIHITGTFDEWISEFNKRLSILQQFTDNITDSNKQMNIMALEYAIKYLNKCKDLSILQANRSITMEISKQSGSPKGWITYKTGFDGTIATIVNEKKTIYKLENSYSGPSDQYVLFDEFISKFFFKDLKCDNKQFRTNDGSYVDTLEIQATNSPNEKSDALLLTEFIAMLIVAKKVKTEEDEEILPADKAKKEIKLDIDKKYSELNQCLRKVATLFDLTMVENISDVGLMIRK